MENIGTKLPAVLTYSDFDEWMEKLSRRASGGDAEAAYELGCRLTDKWECDAPMFDENGIEYHLETCGLDWELYQKPNFFWYDPELGKSWFEIAAQQGHTEALHRVIETGGFSYQTSIWYLATRILTKTLEVATRIAESLVLPEFTEPGCEIGDEFPKHPRDDDSL